MDDLTIWRNDFVQNSGRRSMGDQYVGVIRYLRPAFGQRIPSFKIKGEIEKCRNPGAAPELQPVDFQSTVQQIMSMPDPLYGFLRLLLKAPVVIAGNKNLVLVW